MRSSRRNQGLLPEVTPEDSSLSSQEDGQASEGLSDIVVDEGAPADNDSSHHSTDVNIEDSEKGTHSSESNSEDDSVKTNGGRSTQFELFSSQLSTFSKNVATLDKIVL